MSDIQDDRNLDTLALLHYVLGGLGALISCFPLIYVVLGAFVLISPEAAGKTPDVKVVGWAFIGFGIFFFLLGQVMAWLIIISGKKLKKRKSLQFSFVIACLMCLNVPFGTVLGIFTIIELQKPEVKKLYEGSDVEYV